MRNKRKLLLLLLPLLLLCILLAYFFSAINSLAVHLVAQTGIYRFIEQAVIPAEIQSTLYVLKIFNIQAAGHQAMISTLHEGRPQSFLLAWNCTGWQSMLLLIISFAILFQYKGIVFKKAVIALTGIVWIFFTNIFRITLEIAIYHLAGFQPAMIFHDYFAKAYILIMFALFWFLAYALALKGKAQSLSSKLSYK